METILRQFLAAAALISATLAPSLAPPAFATAESPKAGAGSKFTPLDEIDRVRAAGCGLGDFEEFFTWYASATEGGGWLEQVVWTNYLVKVGELTNPKSEGYWVDRQKYLGQFRISSRDYRFSREGAIVDPDKPYRQVALTRLGEKQYRVDWRGGLGFAGVDRADQDKKAGAYIFEHMKDCWYLTQDLR